jgi:hypothetical protein
VLLEALKRTITASFAAVLISGSAVGLASAQLAPAPSPPATAQPTPWQDHHSGQDRRAFESGEAVGIAAQAIGITPVQLRAELPGRSLAQVAQAHGANPADIATALKNAVNQRIDQEVTQGELTADQAAQQKQMVDQHIDQAVYEVVPARAATPTTSVTPVSTPAGT